MGGRQRVAFTTRAVPALAGVPNGAAASRALPLASISSLSTPGVIQLEKLPFGLKQGHDTLRYVWDGSQVQAFDTDALQHGSIDDPLGLLKRWVGSQYDKAYKAFVPRSKDVTPDYWQWVKWRLSERFCNSTIMNLSTQSMLMALGLGAKKSIAAGAAINWLLKDGVGRIARMTVATNFCQSFDSDLKRIRFLTANIQQATTAFEFLTPFFPQYFLGLTSIAGVGRAVSLATFVAVQPAFQRSLCSSSNLADVTAKSQAQHMLVDMLSLGTSATMMYMVRDSVRGRMLMPIVAFPLLAVADLFATYNEMKSIELRALNRERAEMVAYDWITGGRIPSTAEVSQKEHLFLPPDVDGGLAPMRITSVDRLIASPSDAAQMLRDYSGEQYVMALSMPPGWEPGEPGRSSGVGVGVLGSLSRQVWVPRWPWQRGPHPEMRVSLSEDCEARDVLKAVLEAAHLRHALRRRLEARRDEARPAVGAASLLARMPGMRSRDAEAKGRAPSHNDEPAVAKHRGLFGKPPGEALWEDAGPLLTAEDLQLSRRHARKEAHAGLSRFIAALNSSGWDRDTVLLSTSEKVRYVKMGKA